MGFKAIVFFQFVLVMGIAILLASTSITVHSAIEKQRLETAMQSKVDDIARGDGEGGIDKQDVNKQDIPLDIEKKLEGDSCKKVTISSFKLNYFSYW